MDCPKCASRVLTAVKDADESVLFSCARCHGVWVDGSRSRDIASLPIADKLGAEAHDGAADLRAGVCPHGHGILKRAQTHLDGGFYLERCQVCFGVWFDQGEWHRVLSRGLADELFQIWTLSWQQEQIRLQNRAKYEEEILDKLGAELIEQIDVVAEALRNHRHKSLALGYLMRGLRAASRPGP